MWGLLVATAALVMRPPLTRPQQTTAPRADVALQQLAMAEPWTGQEVPVDIAVTGMNSRCISASIVVSASPAQVWSILTGAPRRPRRSPRARTCTLSHT